MFKKGDIVVCIDVGDVDAMGRRRFCDSLTFGKEYKVTESDNYSKEGMWVRDDTGLSSWYFSKRFEKVSYAAPATVEVLY